MSDLKAEKLCTYIRVFIEQQYLVSTVVPRNSVHTILLRTI
jgi:hypothetical protein